METRFPRFTSLRLVKSFNSFTPHGDGNDGCIYKHQSQLKCFNSFTPHGDGNFIRFTDEPALEGVLIPLPLTGMETPSGLETKPD